MKINIDKDEGSVSEKGCIKYENIYNGSVVAHGKHQFMCKVDTYTIYKSNIYIYISAS